MDTRSLHTRTGPWTSVNKDTRSLHLESFSDAQRVSSDGNPVLDPGAHKPRGGKETTHRHRCTHRHAHIDTETHTPHAHTQTHVDARTDAHTTCTRMHTHRHTHRRTHRHRHAQTSHVMTETVTRETVCGPSTAQEGSPTRGREKGPEQTAPPGPLQERRPADPCSGVSSRAGRR